MYDKSCNNIWLWKSCCDFLRTYPLIYRPSSYTTLHRLISHKSFTETLDSPFWIRAMFVMFKVDGKVHVESQPQHWLKISSAHVGPNFWKIFGLYLSGQGHLSRFIYNRSSLNSQSQKVRWAYHCPQKRWIRESTLWPHQYHYFVLEKDQQNTH